MGKFKYKIGGRLLAGRARYGKANPFPVPYLARIQEETSDGQNIVPLLRGGQRKQLCRNHTLFGDFVYFELYLPLLEIKNRACFVAYFDKSTFEIKCSRIKNRNLRHKMVQNHASLMQR